MDALNAVAVKRANDPKYAADVLSQVIPAMEAMVTDGWVTASLDPNLPLAPVTGGGQWLRWNKETAGS